MKIIKLRDFALTTIVLLIVFALDIFAIKIAKPYMNKLPIEYRGIANIFFFILLIFLLLGVIYSNILKLFLKNFEGKFNALHPPFKGTLWQQYCFIVQVVVIPLWPILPEILKAHFYRLFGAKLGKGTFVAGFFTEPYLVETGKYVHIGRDAAIGTHSIVDNEVILKKVIIKDHATIGARAIIFPGVVVGKNSIVGANSLVLKDTIIPDNEIWAGIPARKIKSINTPNKKEAGGK